MIGKKLLISQIYISYLFHLNLHTLIISAQNSFIYPIVNVPNFSDVILFNKDCKAIKNLTFEELSETLLLHAKVPLINKYVIVNNQAYDIRNMSFLIHTKEGLEPNTFLHFYWMTQYINEPDLEKRYKIYVDYFSDFLQEYKVLHNTYNRKKSKAAQRWLFQNLWSKHPQEVNNSVDISQQFLKQFEEDSFYIHQNGYLQFLGKPLQLNHGIYEYGLIPYFLKGFNKNTPVYGLRSQGVLGEPDAILINNNQCYTIQAKTWTRYSEICRILDQWFYQHKYAMTNVGMRNNPIVCHRQFNIYRQEFDEENIVYNYLEENIYRAVELDQQEHLNNLLLAKKALLEHEWRQWSINRSIVNNKLDRKDRSNNLENYVRNEYNNN